MSHDLNLKIDEFSQFEQFSEIQKEWDELVRQENLGLAHQFDWLRTLQQIHGQEKTTILLARRDGRLAGCAALVLRRERRNGVSATVLQALNAFHQLRGTQFVLANADKNIFEALVESSMHWRHERWDLWFMYFQDGEKQAQFFEEVLNERGIRFTKSLVTRSPYLPLEGSWEDNLKRLQPRFRTSVRSRERKIREKGNLEYRHFKGENEWRDGLDAIQQIESDSWKVRDGIPITHAIQWSFYNEFARIAALNDTLRLSVLYLNGEPLAYDFGIYSDGVYYLLKTSFKESWQADYPGFVLRKFVIEELYQQGAKEIDFGGKEEEWKMKWTNLVRSQVLYTAYNNSLVGRYLSLRNRAGEWLRSRKSNRVKNQVIVPT
jgi:CelD/BcsL family acetyltransferase involved in cellulose biosynthesis